MNNAILAMLKKYSCRTSNEYENALKEIIQEIALLGLWRAKFFEHAAFYGGTALRILYGLDRFSEDLDFTLLRKKNNFDLTSYLNAIRDELNSMGFDVFIHVKNKKKQTAIASGFIKAGTQEHMIRIDVPQQLTQKLHRDSLLEIKMEVDTDPPGNFKVEAKTLLQPIPFSILTLSLPDLFAGKVHAILERSWKGRVKGRDYYDFIWYISQYTPLHLKHLETRLRQTGAWSEKKKLQLGDLKLLLHQKFKDLNVALAKKDISPFIKDQKAIALWSNEFFISILDKLDIV